MYARIYAISCVPVRCKRSLRYKEGIERYTNTVMKQIHTKLLSWSYHDCICMYVHIMCKDDSMNVTTLSKQGDHKCVYMHRWNETNKPTHDLTSGQI